MAEALEAIAEELDLPSFRVPAPQNSAQHAAATATTVAHRRPPAAPAPGRPALPVPRQPASTRQFTPPAPGPAPDIDHNDDFGARPRRRISRGRKAIARIDIEGLRLGAPAARRAAVFWVLAVLVLTGLVAMAGWSVGTNLDWLLGRWPRVECATSQGPSAPAWLRTQGNGVSVAQHFGDQKRQLQ